MKEREREREREGWWISLYKDILSYLERTANNLQKS